MKLKMNILWLLMLLCLPFVSSCKEDLPAYGEAENIMAPTRMVLPVKTFR